MAALWRRCEKTVAPRPEGSSVRKLWNTLHVSRVLVVEDEAHIRELIQLHLGLEGLEIEAVADGQDALVRANSEPFDLVILDLMLPGVDGISICRAVRREGPNQDVPILMLTARREESDKVLGLESGADDYLAKPFGIRELVARARALLRRPRRSQLQAEAASSGERPIEIHGLHIDPARRRVRVKGERRRSHRAGIPPAAGPGVASGHCLQPRSAAHARVARSHLRHRAQRRFAREAAAAPHREGCREPRDHPDGMGQRVQVCGCLSHSGTGNGAPGTARFHAAFIGASVSASSCSLRSR